MKSVHKLVGNPWLKNHGFMALCKTVGRGFQSNIRWKKVTCKKCKKLRERGERD